MFANSCVATEVNEIDFSITSEPQQFKMCFDGCGVTNGTFFQCSRSYFYILGSLGVILHMD